MNHKRLRYMDMAKTVAIMIVVISHCFQKTEPIGLDIVLSVATSFHMPLFMMISGFFVLRTLDLSILDFLKKISKYYIIPFLCFSLIGQLLLLFSDPPSGPLGFMVRWWHFAWLWDYWFIRDLVFFIVLTYISYHIARKNLLLACVVSFVIMNLMPTDIGMAESQEILTPVRKSTVFHLPFFWLGILLRKIPAILDNVKLVWAIPLSCVLLLFFRYENSWYCTPHHTIADWLFCGMPIGGGKYWLSEVYRYFIGLSLSMTIIKSVQTLEVVKKLNGVNNIVGEYGKYTLGIYLIHTLILNNLNFGMLPNSIVVTYLLFPMIILIVSWFLSFIIIKSPFKWILGK